LIFKKLNHLGQGAFIVTHSNGSTEGGRFYLATATRIGKGKDHIGGVRLPTAQASGSQDHRNPLPAGCTEPGSNSILDEFPADMARRREEQVQNPSQQAI
jgi:hypothetical protein